MLHSICTERLINNVFLLLPALLYYRTDDGFSRLVPLEGLSDPLK